MAVTEQASQRKRWAVGALIVAFALALYVLGDQTEERQAVSDSLPGGQEPSESPPGLGVRVGSATPPNPCPEPTPEAQRTLTITGKVVDEWNKPVPDGSVRARVQLESLAYVERQVESAVDGRGLFSMRVGIGSAVSVRLAYRKDDSQQSPFRFLRVSRLPSLRATVTLVAFRTATLDVRVVDWQGNAARGAVVRSHPVGLLGRDARCDQSGHCRVRMHADPSSSLRAYAADGSYGQTKALHLQPGEQREVLVKLTKRLRDTPVRCVSSGGALSGHSVRIRRLNERDWHALVVDGAPTPVRLPAAGPVGVIIEIGQVGRRSVRWKDIRTALTAGDLVIELEDLGRLEFKVADEHGLAMPNLRLKLTRERQESRARHIRIRGTNGGGAAAVGPLAYGSYRVRVDGFVDEVVVLDRRVLQHTLVMRGASRIRGTFTGPAAIGGKPVQLAIRLPDGREWRMAAPEGDGAQRAWVMALPIPVGSPLSVQSLLGKRPLGSSVQSSAGSSVAVDVSKEILRVHPMHGTRRWLRGWIELSPVGGSVQSRLRTFIRAQDGFAEFPMPPPGLYRVRHCLDPWGTTGNWAAQQLRLTRGVTAASIDVAP